MRCGKSTEGHIKYFYRVLNCNPAKTIEKKKKTSEYFEPTEKRQKWW